MGTNTTEQRMLSLALIASLIASSYAVTCSTDQIIKANTDCKTEVETNDEACKAFFSQTSCIGVPQTAETCACRNAAETCVEGKLSDCTLPTSGPVATTNGTMAADPCVTKCQEVGCSAAQCGDASVVGVSAVAIVAAAPRASSKRLLAYKSMKTSSGLKPR